MLRGREGAMGVARDRAGSWGLPRGHHTSGTTTLGTRRRLTRAQAKSSQGQGVAQGVGEVTTTTGRTGPGAAGEGARYVSSIEDATGRPDEPLDTVPPFTFKELLMLKALAKFGSIKAAAEHLYVSQSSVSSQLSSLEQKIQATLVNRHPGIQGASFTEEGQVS